METLKRSMSFQVIKQESPTLKQQAESLIEDAKCECCGMSEECTPRYVKKVRGQYGQMICGLCTEAVKEEMNKSGGKKNKEEALHAHVAACSRFNRRGRPFPVLCQAEEMRQIFRNHRAKSFNPPTNAKPPIARSSSCIPAMTKEINALNMA